MTNHNQPAGVLYVANSAKIGGGNRVLMDLMKGLDRVRFRPALVTPSQGPLVDWALETGLTCHLGQVGGGSRLDFLGEAWALVRLMRALQARIVHAISPACYRAAGLAGRLTRAARVCHLQFPPDPGQLAWCFRFGPDAVVTCYDGQADEVRSELGRIRPHARLVAIANSVDTDAFTPAPPDPTFRFGASHVVLIIGHLSELKGYTTFLRAAASVRDRIKGVAFVALGGETIEPGARARYETLARDLGIGSAVHFLGWRPEVASVIRAADVVVLPSQVEGLPLSVLEAMACARPTVASRVNGTPEAVADGVTGLLIPPDDSGALGGAILDLLSNPERARQMGEEGRRRVVDRFSLRKYVQRTEALYSDLLNRPSLAINQRACEEMGSGF